MLLLPLPLQLQLFRGLSSSTLSAVEFPAASLVVVVGASDGVPSNMSSPRTLSSHSPRGRGRFFVARTIGMPVGGFWGGHDAIANVIFGCGLARASRCCCCCCFSTTALEEWLAPPFEGGK